MQPSIFPTAPLSGYSLLDSGGGEKLERFGPVLLRRPDPQALWRPRLTSSAWDAADLSFVRESDRGGRWEPRRGARSQTLNQALGETLGSTGSDAPSWKLSEGTASFIIKPTPFKHVGLFPEQASNWRAVEALRSELKGKGIDRPRLLNLFGYTGAASVLAAKSGWDVTHVDASKTAITWTVDNAEASGLGRTGMRVICEDAMRFARREVRRESRYHAVLLDPPHYGRGPKGEVWQLEDHLAELVETAGAIVEPQCMVVLSTYAVGYSPLAFQNLFADLGAGTVQAGELAIPETLSDTSLSPRHLPAGFCARWARGCMHDAANGG